MNSILELLAPTMLTFILALLIKCGFWLLEIKSDVKRINGTLSEHIKEDKEVQGNLHEDYGRLMERLGK